MGSVAVVWRVSLDNEEALSWCEEALSWCEEALSWCEALNIIFIRKSLALYIPLSF